MNKSKQIYTLNEIKQIASSVFSLYPTIQSAYIFGSYARGKATPNSDLDFLIKLVDDEFITLKKSFIVDVDLEDAFHKQVDVLTNRDLLKLRSKNIEREMILIYELLSDE